jgi:formate dehydrogenase iron-sulfur subunit
MSIDRRSFFKVLGLTGISLAAGTKLNASVVKESGDVEFKAILIDTTRCEGCQSCEFACAEANGLPEPQDSPAAGTIRKLDENRRSVINGYETSKGEVYVKQQCMHCNEPACAAGLSYRRDDKACRRAGDLGG